MSSPIGFVGLGRMGRPMAGHLAAAGHPVLGHDRLPAAREALAGTGVTLAADLAALAAACRIVILMLPDSAAVDALLWQEGLAAGLAPGSLVIDMGSSDPDRTRENHQRLAQSGIALLDAPVSGGVRRALDASLAIMVGGEAAALERARPLLQRLGATVAHVGPPGAGHALKALNNFVSASGLLAVCEALVAAQRFGIDPAAANALFNASSGRNNTTETKVAQFMLSGSFGSGFSLALMRKDIATARGLMHALGVPHGFVDACAEIWSQAERSLPPGVDHTEMYRHVMGAVPPPGEAP
ncbi:MAG: NAD(P)-dependent oxidoreductase [Betaproteobacteria bacterium]|nr:NAD(P)-dependent oxidoreductase [Betaproteobacteria bacterium]